MHRILAILVLVILTCFLSIGGNQIAITDSEGYQVLPTYNSIVIENYDDMYSMSVAELVSEGGSNNAMKDIIR